MPLKPTPMIFNTAYAAKIGDLHAVTMWDQILRFGAMNDMALQHALIGSVLLGICCGILGSFIVVRKMALMGDALSHAVLPGVALGFLWSQSKDPVAIFIGAILAGLLGTALVSWIKQTTRIKEDAAIGMVLASFFGIGISLITMIQKLPTGNKSGIDKFLFGQAAAISSQDLHLMMGVTVIVLAIVGFCYKELLCSSFDDQFARAIGLPTRVLHYLLMLLLAFSVVIALQAVGVVLVSAMLITPAAAAYLLTDRMHRLIFIAAGIGVLAGVLGAFFSFLGNNLPTGPFMVLAAGMVFLLVFLLAPRHGILVRLWLKRSQSARIQRENNLKAIYHVLEKRGFRGDSVTLEELAQRRQASIEEVQAQAKQLGRHGFATVHDQGRSLLLTPSGWQRACAIVRNHRLWELYLTSEVHIAADRVHDDAEVIEHVLGEAAIRRLEEKLSFPSLDPHGRPIPTLTEQWQGVQSNSPGERSLGYGKPLS